MAIGTCRTKGGCVPIGRSAPATQTCVAALRAPTRFSTSASRTPVQVEVPTAPLRHWMPATGGSKNARPLPAHSSVTVTVVAGIWRNSASESDAGVLASPSMARRHAASSSPVGTGMWQRT